MRIKSLPFSLLIASLVMFFLLTITGKCRAYILPAEQLIDFMTKNFSTIRTLVITQSTLQTDLVHQQERVFTEEIRMKAPDLFQYKVLEQSEDRHDSPYMSYRQLLMANTGEQIRQLLMQMGIDLEIVAYTRIDGIIAYRIGLKGPEEPKLLIEKKRFVPLLLIYRIPGPLTAKMVTVRFQEYRKQDDAWYPFEIGLSVEDSVKEQYKILTYQSNIPVDASILVPFLVRPGMDDSLEKRPAGVENPEDERLKKIIKTFEKKYP